MAFNLAVGIRAANPDVPIAIIHTREHVNNAGQVIPDSLGWLSDKHLGVFTHFIEATPEQYTHEGRTQYQRLKTFTYELSPFKHTLCLDADTAWSWMHRVEDVVAPYRDRPFTAMNYLHKNCGDTSFILPKHSYVFWADDGDIGKAWGVQGRRIYQIQSSFYYFTKGKEAKAYFDKVRWVYDNPKLTVMEWANSIPDEYAYNVATAITGIELHESPYHPLFVPYTQNYTREVKIDRIAAKWCGISMAGSRISSMPMHSAYDTFVAYACRQLGLVSHWPYRLLEKKIHQPERAKH